MSDRLEPPAPHPAEPVKPGWQTSEFWLTAAHLLVVLFVALGVVATADQTRLDAALSAGVTASFGLISSAAVIYHYIRGRLLLKSQYEEKGQ